MPPPQASHYVLHLKAPPAPNPGSDLEHQTISLWRYFEDYGTFRRWGLTGGSRSLGACLRVIFAWTAVSAVQN